VGVCDVCGNAMDAPACRFCGARKEADARGKHGPLYKTVNLEHGRPFVAEAMEKLLHEIMAARLERVRVLSVIHGYGSSGKGGAIKSECRANLDYLWSTGKIKGFIPGEDFSGKNGPGKALLQRFPELAKNKNLTRKNPGVTLVIME
jgi:hypothetical protein